jgi:hypothetical protein
MNADQFREVVRQVAPKVKDGAPAYRHCFVFSSLLGGELRTNGIPALPYQDHDYHLISTKGETSGHTVTLAQVNPDLWAAVDLTSEIIPGIPPDMIWIGSSIAELGKAIDVSLPGLGSSLAARMTEIAFQQIVSSLLHNNGMLDDDLLFSLGLY